MKKLLTTFILIFILSVMPVKSANKIIILDPGHGGYEPGAVYKGLEEEDVNLDIAYRTKTLLENAGYTVYMTRIDDTYKSNNDRYTFANSMGGQLLVSIHLNGSTDHTIDGTMGLYGPKWLKDREFTKVMHNVLLGNLRIRDFGIRNFASGVLLKSDMPATMQETVFISSDYEWALLTDGTGNRQQQIAQALFEGINNWIIYH